MDFADAGKDKLLVFILARPNELLPEEFVKRVLLNLFLEGSLVADWDFDEFSHIVLLLFQRIGAVIR